MPETNAYIRRMIVKPIQICAVQQRPYLCDPLSVNLCRQLPLKRGPPQITQFEIKLRIPLRQFVAFDIDAVFPLRKA